MEQNQCYELKSFELDKRTNSYIRVTQENSIESSFTKQFTLYTSTNSPC